MESQAFKSYLKSVQLFIQQSVVFLMHANNEDEVNKVYANRLILTIELMIFVIGHDYPGDDELFNTKINLRRHWDLLLTRYNRENVDAG